jgi:LacI family transcriptional regulator
MELMNPSSPSDPPRIAILIEGSNAYGRGLLTGIRRFLHEHGPWVVFVPEHGRGTPPLDAIRRWEGEGMIARIETPEIAAAVNDARRRQSLALVDVSAAGLAPDAPCVETDDAAIAALAVKHFRQRKFSNFAYIGDSRFRWSQNRGDAFAHELAGMATVHRFDVDQAVHEGKTEDGALAEWLRALPKPVGLFAGYDARGRQVIDACRDMGLSVPDDVAVLGVDDDPLLCSLASTPLSSIVPDAEGAGWRAAELIDRLLHGAKLPRTLWLLPPLGITQRQSTATIACDDPIVAGALKYIREEACRGIKVSDVAKAVGTTRHVLAGRFLKQTGHSPHEEIVRVQFRQVETLLVDTDLSLTEIAARTGFRHAEYMTVAFNRRYGTPPSRWRKAQRRGS